MTVRQLSEHQLHQLNAYFTLTSILKIGLVLESGDLIIEFRDSNYQPQTTTIPRNDLLAKDAEFEIIQPKQLT